MIETNITEKNLLEFKVLTMSDKLFNQVEQVRRDYEVSNLVLTARPIGWVKSDKYEDFYILLLTKADALYKVVRNDLFEFRLKHEERDKTFVEAVKATEQWVNNIKVEQKQIFLK